MASVLVVACLRTRAVSLVPAPARYIDLHRSKPVPWYLALEIRAVSLQVIMHLVELEIVTVQDTPDSYFSNPMWIKPSTRLEHILSSTCLLAIRQEYSVDSILNYVLSSPLSFYFRQHVFLSTRHTGPSSLAGISCYAHFQCFRPRQTSLLLRG